MLLTVPPLTLGAAAGAPDGFCAVEHLGAREFRVRWMSVDRHPAAAATRDGGLSWTVAPRMGIGGGTWRRGASTGGRLDVGGRTYALRNGGRTPGKPPSFPGAPLVVSMGPDPWRDLAIADEPPGRAVSGAALAAGRGEIIVAYLAAENSRAVCRVIRVPLTGPPPAASAWSPLPALPGGLGLAGVLAGSHGGAIIAAGGTNFPDRPPWEGGARKTHDGVRVFDPARPGWEPAGRLPEPRAYGACVSTPRGVVVAGGENAGKVLADCLLLRWNGRGVETAGLPPLPRPAAQAAIALLDGCLYLAGGYDRGAARVSRRAFWRLDLRAEDRGWEELPAWPGPARAQAVAAAVGGAFYLISGLDTGPGAAGAPRSAYLRDAYCFRPGSGWTRLPDLPWSAVAAPSPAPVSAAPARVFVVGGVDGEQVGRLPREAPLPNDILYLDVARGEWRLWREPSPQPVVTIPAVPWAGGWTFVSGETGAGRRTPQVWHWAAPPAPAVTGHPGGGRADAPTLSS